MTDGNKLDLAVDGDLIEGVTEYKYLGQTLAVFLQVHGQNTKIISRCSTLRNILQFETAPTFHQNC